MVEYLFTSMPYATFFFVLVLFFPTVAVASVFFTCYTLKHSVKESSFLLPGAL